MTARANDTSHGFTIVELLIVIVVIAILAALASIAYSGIQDRARISVVKSDLSQASKQLEVDKTLATAYPGTVSAADGGRGLKASKGTTYQYTVNNTANPPTFCLTAVNGSQAYHITQGDSPTQGVCPGHTGPSSGDGGGSIVCSTGYIPVPGNSTFGTSDFCVGKYEARNVSGTAVSQAPGPLWVNVTQPQAVTAAGNACSGCHLVTEAEWLTIAHNIAGVASNWSSGSVGSGSLYTGYVNGEPYAGMELAASSSDSDGLYGMANTGNPPASNNRRTLSLSNGEVIWDFSGNLFEWTDMQSGTGHPPGKSGQQFVEWNSVAYSGDLTPSPFPSFGTPAASGWTSANGIGRLGSIVEGQLMENFLRGGSWVSGDNAGVFSLNMTFTPTYGAPHFGFRVAK